GASGFAMRPAQAFGTPATDQPPRRAELAPLISRSRAEQARLYSRLSASRRASAESRAGFGEGDGRSDTASANAPSWRRRIVAASPSSSAGCQPSAGASARRTASSRRKYGWSPIPATSSSRPGRENDAVSMRETASGQALSSNTHGHRRSFGSL